MLVPSPFPETPLADLSSDGFTEVNLKSLPLSVSWLLVSLFIFHLCFVMPVKMVAEISPVSNQPVGMLSSLSDDHPRSSFIY
ncbi:hypothetical protein BHE74_00006851 [Ensete ventricosum]|nr:hypothetical protein BHE74_00006851 [Ensete ventricosum]RZR85541.1 hypothetical protein BHM03_00012548 [Ensete ventricosum]